jgi:hypothetical protein
MHGLMLPLKLGIADSNAGLITFNDGLAPAANDCFPPPAPPRVRVLPFPPVTGSELITWRPA